MKSCGWTWWHQNVLAISDRPEFLHRDSDGRLHHQSEAAISYRDGWKLHFWHGLCVPDYVIERPTEITIAKIKAENNAEVRRVMIERFGESRYITESGIKAIAHDENFGTLYFKNLEYGKPICKVRVVNSSPEPDGTFKIYWLSINPEKYNGDAGRIPQAAVASTWRTKPAGQELLYKNWQEYCPQIET